MTVCATAVLCAVFAFGVRPSHAEEINQRKLEYEFARFVQGRLDSEPEVRAALSGFVKQNRAKFSEGLGMHPELVPPMMEAAGLAKMNCISGRYFPALEKGLDKDGFSFFYGVKEELDHWVTMVAVEEAVREKVYSPSPPLNYRRRSDFPPFIALALREVIRPYLREGPGLGPGVGFDGLTCE
ncbi:MAG: hypothetical protein HZA22_10200 [Nitrospirae bacterium]|nr:hypothetical protein [Nitrospirota bacterium]MBI5695878.1 hypothetical protein [Nitrospirota bacterium]